MNSPKNVVLLLVTDVGGKHRRALDEPTQATLSNALADLYLELAEDDHVAEITAAFDGPTGRQIVDVDGVEIFPEQIASYFWREMVGC